MNFTAAILRDGTDRMSLETVTLADLRDDEVLVRLVATGICHSDVTVRDGLYPIPRPIVIGHEGSGYVEQAGAAVTKVKPGDPVVLSFASCGACRCCAADAPAYCQSFMALNIFGRRLDGSSALRCEGESIGGHFFSQSSFATHSVARESNIVKVRADAPLEQLGPFGCGIQTGAGAILNALAPKSGDSLVVLGAGAVGLSAVMAGVVTGCTPIIVSEPNAARRALALEVGATHVISPLEIPDLTAELIRLTGAGADCIFDTSGIPPVIDSAIAALGPRGKMGFVAMNKVDARASFALAPFFGAGQTLRGVCEGDSVPDVFIPQLIDYFMEGRFPADKLVTFYEFEQLNQALDDQASGAAVKPIVRIGAA